MSPPKSASALGLAYALAAFGAWGTLALFWRQLSHVPASELLGQRVVWSLGVFFTAAWFRRQLPEVLAALRKRRVLMTLAMSASLLALNWFTFVYSIETQRLLHASIGYFLNPLLSVALGVLVLRERLRPLQLASVALAASGVMTLALRADVFPWIALVLSISFALYGLIRKTVAVEALPGSTIESLLLSPFALAYLVWLGVAGRSHFSEDGRTTTLILLTGLATAFPLFCFTEAARRLKLSTLGFVQFVAPTGQLLVAVLIFGEAFTTLHALSFGLVWAALLLFSVDAWRHRVGVRVPAPQRAA